MAEQKMVSIEKMDNIIKENFKDETVVDFYGQEIVVRRMITANEVMEFVETAANACFDPDTGEYHPELKDFLLRSGTLLYYTNVRLPDDAEHRYKIVCGTDLADMVYKYANRAQLCGIEAAIDTLCEMRTDANRVQFEQEIRKATDAVAKLTEQISTLFDGVSPEDMKAIVSALGDGVDEEKLVKAVVAEQNKIREEK